MRKPQYSTETLETARELLGIDSADELDEALENFRAVISILREWDDWDCAEQQGAECPESH